MIMPVITLRLRRVIIDVDTQRYFFLNNGIAHVRNHRRVLTNIRRVVAWSRLKNIRMISTVQDYAGDNRYRNLCIASIEHQLLETGRDEGQKKVGYTLRNRRTSFDATDCTDLPLGILEQYDQVIFHKRCFDPFEEPRADRMLTELQADEFILIGAITEGAVKATALGLLARRKNVTVLVDATGSHGEAAANIALLHMWAKGAKLTDTETILGSSCLRLARTCRCYRR